MGVKKKGVDVINSRQSHVCNPFGWVIKWAPPGVFTETPKKRCALDGFYI